MRTRANRHRFLIDVSRKVQQQEETQQKQSTRIIYIGSSGETTKKEGNKADANTKQTNLVLHPVLQQLLSC